MNPFLSSGPNHSWLRSLFIGRPENGFDDSAKKSLRVNDYWNRAIIPSHPVHPGCEGGIFLATLRSSEMPKFNAISRRQFVSAAMSAAAVSSLGLPKAFSRAAGKSANWVDKDLAGASWRDQ